MFLSTLHLFLGYYYAEYASAVLIKAKTSQEKLLRRVSLYTVPYHGLPYIKIFYHLSGQMSNIFSTKYAQIFAFLCRLFCTMQSNFKIFIIFLLTKRQIYG